MDDGHGSDDLPMVTPDSSPTPYWSGKSSDRDWRLDLVKNAQGGVERGGVLVVALAGIGQGDTPRFEFRGALEAHACHKLYLRDSKIQWFVPNKDHFVEVIRNAQAASGAVRAVFLGASAGGWGALFLQASFFPEADVVTFSPQAFLDSATRSEEDDERWAPYVNHLNQRFSDPNLLTIRGASRPKSSVCSRVEVHYNVHHYLDARHAAHLRRVHLCSDEEGEDDENRNSLMMIRCVPHDGPRGDDAHALAWHLRGTGELAAVLSSFLHRGGREHFEQSPTPLFDEVDVNEYSIPRFDLEGLRAACQKKTMTEIASSFPSLQPDLPQEAVEAMRKAMTETGFFLLRPSREASSPDSTEANRSTSRHVLHATESVVENCYAACAAMASSPDDIKESKWSAEAAQAAGLFGGWRRGDSDLIKCDSFRCSLENLPRPSLPESAPEGGGLQSMPAATDASDAAAEILSGHRVKRHLWPAEEHLPGFRHSLETYTEAILDDVVPCLCKLFEQALGLPAGWLASRCGRTNPLSYLTTRVYPPADAEDEGWGMRMQ